MNTLVLSVWALTIAIDTVGQLAFKAAAFESRTNQGLAHWKFIVQRPWLWLGIICYIVEFVVWLAFLSLVPLSIGVMLGCINIVVIMFAGRMFFKEKLTRNRLVGIALIALGVAIVGIGA
ncbi:EamA family transporter [Acinetobacter sp. WZC-1]|uniref:EamA family transporter n=1 Tax=Acinetobacter sp. WZC-1 TaxID=3459034 RepID=UPI00403DFCF1